MSVTVAALIERSLVAYAALAAAAETVEDEAQYLADLTTVWRARLDQVARARKDEAAGDELVGVVESLEDQAARIVDPHRAFDWLSTFPQVILLALGEPA